MGGVSEGSKLLLSLTRADSMLRKPEASSPLEPCPNGSSPVPMVVVVGCNLHAGALCTQQTCVCVCEGCTTDVCVCV